MDFQEQFVQVLLNLIAVLRVASAQLSQLMPEEIHLPKVISAADISPVMKFALGPFETPDDHFYRSHRYLKEVNLKNNNIRERIAGIKDRKETEIRKTELQEIPARKTHRESAESQEQKSRSAGVQAKRTHSTAAEEPSSEVLGALQRLRHEMKGLRTLSELLSDLKAEVYKVETALAVEPFEKLLTVLEKSFPPNENRNKLKPVSGNIFNGINNITYNNQYQIENVFAINRLSGRIESKLKEADAQIINELTDRKTNEVLEKAVHNLAGDGGDFPAAEQLSLHPNEAELVAQLQKNFSAVFGQQNVSLDQINQMSRIIDFVERYHGAVGSMKGGWGSSREGGGVRGRARGTRWKERGEGTVLRDEGFHLSGGEGERKRGTVRRKGGIATEPEVIAADTPARLHSVDVEKGTKHNLAHSKFSVNRTQDLDDVEPERASSNENMSEMSDVQKEMSCRIIPETSTPTGVEPANSNFVRRRLSLRTFNHQQPTAEEGPTLKHHLEQVFIKRPQSKGD